MPVNWYADCKDKDIEGCFVNVQLENGTMISGRLDGNGNILAPTLDGCNLITVLRWSDGFWEKNSGVDSVRLVWNDKEWAEIPVEDAHEDDLLEINGRLHRITYVSKGDDDEIEYWIATDDVDLDDMDKCTKTSVFEGHDIVARALRSRSRIPDEPGVYRSQNGDLYINPDTKSGDCYFVPAEVADKVSVVHGEAAEADFHW